MISQNTETKIKVIKLLSSLPVYKTNSLVTQHVVRCPYCGDSHNESHGHFSIKIDPDSDEPMIYRCLKCDVAGLLNATTLEELGLYIGQDVRDSLKSFNKKIIKKNKFINNNIENFIVPKFQENAFTHQRLDYINERLGSEIDYVRAQELKIILDLKTFLQANNIEAIPDVNPKFLYLLDKNYVGFLSTNNNCITLRRISDNDKLQRYVKIILNPKNINSNTFYSIPNSISLMYTHDINIRITEGIFDILSVYNMNDRVKNVDYYFASCGFGYLTILKYLIYNGINTGLNVHIYSDNDKTDRDHFKYLFKNSSVSIWMDKIIMHRNAYDHEKDYGVPLSRIIDSTFKIK